ncbi:MAG TPA: hypothetical protein VMJ64_04205 [Anaerolineales bacterium]|nr:hypothetical protein [Anaerolineales bacterium]
MKNFPRILSVLGVVFSYVMLVLCVLGIVGVWVLRANVIQAADRVFQAADVALVQTVSRIEEAVKNGQDLQASLDALSTTIQAKGKTVQDNPVVLQAVDQALDGKLIPALVKLDGTWRDIYAGLTRINYALNTLSDSFLFRDRDGMVKQSAAFLTGATNSMDELDAGLRELQVTARAQKANVTERVVDRLTQPIDRLSRGVDTAQSMLTIIQTGLQSIQTRLSAAHDALLRTILLLTVIATLLLAWIAYTQYVTARVLWNRYKGFKSESGPAAAQPVEAAAAPSQD